MKTLRRILALVGLAALCSAACAQYPDKPIKLVVSASAGAATDLLGRVLAERLAPRLGGNIVVENKPGASSIIAAEQVAKSPPDGYTLMLSPNTLLMAPHVLAKGTSGVDVVKDIVPIVKAASTPLVILAYPGTGLKSVKELIDLARRQPGLAYATGGTGSALHVAGELFQRAAGVKLEHVPYKGLAQATPDVVAGRVPLMFGTPGGVMGQMIDTGKLIPLAVQDKERSPLLPNVPTLDESGIRGADLDAWFMMFAPAGTPQPILRRLNQESTAVLQLPEVRKRLNTIGVQAVGSTLDEAARIVAEDYRRYGKIVTEFGIKSE
jgi:tripartite-type tricarboxylate transporter receptor subunit TctC